MVEQQTTSTNDRAKRTGVDPLEGWHISVARFLGRATGWATVEAQAVARRTTDVARGAFESSAHDVERVSELVRDLVELVGARSVEGTGALENEPEFWRLVSELHEAHKWSEQTRRTPSDRAEVDVDATRSDVIEVQVAEPRATREASPTDDETLQSEDEVAAADGEEPEEPVQDEPRARARRKKKGESE